ncbi:MAG: DNA cytosine methyltransferase [Sporichthyaceae bacterium]|nr:DNA cytosine methyltransferase [Sporichthyaceae bacterium]
MSLLLTEPLVVASVPELDRPDPLLRALDLFAGAGGLSEGFRQAGFRIVAGTDIDPDACATYAHNFQEAWTVCGDIRDPRIRERVLEAGRDVDVVVGGPPCQAFSQVRNHARLIDDPRNSLYREFVAIVRELTPPAFLMENVPGLAQMGVLEQVLEDLSLAGAYDVNPQVVDAADFGVPQTRKRIVFLGVRNDLGISPLMLAGTGATACIALARIGNGYGVQHRGEGAQQILERLADPADTSIVTVAQAISDLHHLPAGRREDAEALDKLPESGSAYQRLMRMGDLASLTNVSVPRVNADTVTRLQKIPPGGNYRDLSDDLKRRYLSGQKWGPSNGTGTLGRAHYYAYRRLHPEIWAWTLNTKADSAYHYGLPRALSVREFARLQSFPDRFDFVTDPRRGELPGRIGGGAAHSRYRQVGNAVPPRLAAAIASELTALLRTARSRARGE